MKDLFEAVQTEKGDELFGLVLDLGQERVDYEALVNDVKGSKEILATVGECSFIVGASYIYYDMYEEEGIYIRFELAQKDLIINGLKLV